MTDTAYVFALDQYIRRISPTADADEAYGHRIGDIVQLQISRPPVEIMFRHHGGFGVVYIVRSITDGMISAVKSPRLDLHDALEQLDDFAREATLWRNLPAHPFVLPATRVFRYDRRPYVETPYVPPITTSGSSLGSVLADGGELTGLSTGVATLTIGQLLSALEFLEQAVPGFAHGDIKPANVLLNAENGILSEMTVQLSDFGLARALGHIGSASSVTGDPYYLPPEWLRSGAGASSPAGQSSSKMQDIYAFGCTAMELLLNLRWQAPDQDGQWRTLVDNGLTLDHLTNTRPDIGIAALRILWRCVGVPPEQRWFDFRALAQAWHDAMAARVGTVTRPLSSWTPLGSALVKDDGPDGNKTYQYLIQTGTTAEEAERVCAILWDASQHRAVGRIEQSSALLAGIHAAYPTLATAVASEAHGLSVMEDRLEEAISLYHEAIRLYQADKMQQVIDSQGYAAACATLAQLLLGKDDPGAHRTALTLAQEAVAAEPSIGRLHATLGHALMAAGDFEGSVRPLEEAARLDPGHSFVAPLLCTARGLASGALFDPVGLSDLEPSQRSRVRYLWTRLSPAFRRLDTLMKANRLEDAAEFLGQVEKECRKRDDRGGQAQALHNLAVVLRKLDRLADAVTTHRQAAAMFASVDRPNSGGDQIYFAGLIYLQMLQFEEAAAAHREASEVFARTRDEHRHAQALLGLGVALTKLRRWDEAVAACERAAHLWAGLADPGHEADAWEQLAEAQLAAGRPAEAVAAFREALIRYKDSNNHSGHGQTLDNLGLALSKLGRHEEAMAAHREAVSLIDEHSNENEWLLAQSHIIAELVKQDAFDEAIAAAETALGVVDVVSRSPAAASVFNNVGLALAGRQRFSEAIAMHRQAAESHQLSGNKRGQARALNNMGVALARIQRLDDAMAAFMAAAQISAEVDDAQGEAEALLNAGLKLNDAENFSAAVITLRRAADKSAAYSDGMLQGKVLHNLASVLDKDGRLQEAIAVYEEAATVYGQSGNRTARGEALHNLGMIRHRLGQYDLAAAALREDRDICESEHDTLGEAQTLRNLAAVLQAANRLGEAQEALRSAAARYASAGERAAQGEVLHDLGRLFTEQEHIDEALATLREAASMLGSSSNDSRRCLVLVDLGLLLGEKANSKEAIATCQEAVSLSEGLGQPSLVGYAHLGLGSVLIGAARLTQAKQAFVSARAKFAEAQEPELVKQADQALAIIVEAESTGSSAQ